MIIHKKSICTPVGTECYKSIEQKKENCLASCRGVFADVIKKTNVKRIEDMVDFRGILEEYKKYKSGYRKSKAYTQEIGGKFINCFKKSNTAQSGLLSQDGFKHATSNFKK